MARFAELPPLPSREKPETILLPGGAKAEVLVRPLSGVEEMSARQYALAEAKSRGVRDPADGDAIYDASYWSYVVACTYLDTDSPKERREPFFANATEALGAFGVEGTAYLFQLQQRWQEEVSPTHKARSFGELVDHVERIAMASGDGFFLQCSPSTQVALARFMASLLVTSPDTSWRNGSPAAASTTPRPSGPARPQRKLRRPPRGAASKSG